MTVKGRTTHGMSVMLSPALYARWLAYVAAHPGQSFNGLIVAYLERTLPHTQEGQP
jgi:hypothetical protein